MVFFNLFALLGLVNSAPAFKGKMMDRSSDILPIYDYVVVGGGLSGLVVANRLSENPETTVLIIEAGGFTENEDFVTIPLITSGNVFSLPPGPIGSKYDWNLTGIPQPELLNRSVKTPAGKVIGGGTVLNGMVFNRGSKADYDRWEELGNPGWIWENLLPYFKKSEHFTPPDVKLEAEGWDVEFERQYHGERGFVQSSFAEFVWPSTRNYINAMKELNVPILKDSMGGNAVGGYWFTQSLDPKNETRSTSQGFYAPDRPFLHLLTYNTVTRIIIESGTAKGVEFATDEKAERSTVQVSREVILAAGALHTPQLLQLSGIGEEAHLSSLGIETVVDLPGVGHNYHDHILLYTGQTVNINPNLANFTNPTYASSQLALYKATHTGPYTTVAGNFFAFLPTSSFSNTSSLLTIASQQSPPQYLPSNTPPTVLAGYKAQFEILKRDLERTDLATMEFIFDDTSILPALHQPFSRGTVTINTTNPFSPPVIDPRYLSNPLDLSLFISAFNYTRMIRATSSLQSISVTETYPGLETVTSQAEIEKFIRGGVSTEHHHSGTASMLPRELGGVVDSNLKVYGVRGLRVVDASTVCMVPSAHLQATIYGVAEKAADLIKSSHDSETAR